MKIVLIVLVVFFLGCKTKKTLTDSSNNYRIISTEFKPVTALMPTFQCKSVQVAKMIEIFEDSCSKRYNCEGLKHLIVSFYISKDTNQEKYVVISPHYRRLTNSLNPLEDYKSSDFVVIYIDSTDLFIKKDALYSSNYFTDIEYLGERKYTLKFERFQDCMTKKGMVLSIRYNYLPKTDSVSVQSYGEYIPTRD